MKGERHVVDNRVFLLGLDELYRLRMKSHEQGELLECARQIAGTLDVAPADVPIEGYYAEDARLTEYFRLLRALQVEPNSRVARVEHVAAYRRLYDVTSSRLFGRPRHEDMLLPVGHDALSEALKRLVPHWTVPSVTAAAAQAARVMDDCSLVGLAARAKDSVVLTALRESVVLYAATFAGSLSRHEPPVFEWRVDDELADAANRFIRTFHALFPVGARLPAATAENAPRYWGACNENVIIGRCVRIGYDDQRTPVMHYHWAINRSGHLAVDEFWAPEIWTTERYRHERADQTPVQGARLEGLKGPHDLIL